MTGSEMTQKRQKTIIEQLAEILKLREMSLGRILRLKEQAAGYASDEEIGEAEIVVCEAKIRLMEAELRFL